MIVKIIHELPAIIAKKVSIPGLWWSFYNENSIPLIAKLVEISKINPHPAVLVQNHITPPVKTGLLIVAIKPLPENQ